MLMPRRRRIPPELRRKTWTEGTVWELLSAAGWLPYRFASPLADLSLTARQRQKQRQEATQLQTTPIAYLLPQPGTARRPAVPWLYVRTTRGAHYRIGTDGAITRYGRRIQRLDSGSITTHTWYACDLRGVRWLQIIATGRMIQHTPATIPSAEPLIAALPPLAANLVQLRLL
ncbi:MAG: hypothetical protein AB4911_13010 [Oscillochloridaceae bacterium umkhey_bin13]